MFVLFLSLSLVTLWEASATCNNTHVLCAHPTTRWLHLACPLHTIYGVATYVTHEYPKHGTSPGVRACLLHLWHKIQRDSWNRIKASVWMYLSWVDMLITAGFPVIVPSPPLFGRSFTSSMKRAWDKQGSHISDNFYLCSSKGIYQNKLWDTVKLTRDTYIYKEHIYGFEEEFLSRKTMGKTRLVPASCKHFCCFKCCCHSDKPWAVRGWDC